MKDFALALVITVRTTVGPKPVHIKVPADGKH